MPRYVVLHHRMPLADSRPSHWDFLLERGGCLHSWALEREPNSGTWIAAIQLPHHRLEYLDYEGPVSGNRGDVSQWDAGHYDVQMESADELQLTLAGRILRGGAILHRDPSNPQRWKVVFSSEDSCAER